jgi:aryl-alcohol dehydrogenase-like predicted oxidoreductase
MSHPAVTAPIIGPDNLSQLEAYLAAAAMAMDASLRQQITSLSMSYDYGIERTVD